MKAYVLMSGDNYEVDSLSAITEGIYLSESKAGTEIYLRNESFPDRYFWYECTEIKDFHETRVVT
jgi:hypothetical protein